MKQWVVGSAWWVVRSAVLLGCAAPLAGQAVLSGVVRQDSSGKPLPGVEVLLDKSKHQTVTDASGRYVLPGLPTGRKVILFRYVGYRPDRQWVQLSKEDTVRLNATLVPATTQLDPIIVKATAAPPPTWALSFT